MRMTDLKQLLEGYKEHKIDPSPYYWYNDQRTYGTMEHGGLVQSVFSVASWYHTDDFPAADMQLRTWDRTNPRLVVEQVYRPRSLVVPPLPWSRSALGRQCRRLGRCAVAEDMNRFHHSTRHCALALVPIAVCKLESLSSVRPSAPNFGLELDPSRAYGNSCKNPCDHCDKG